MKKRVIIEDVPSINSLAELRAVLKDPVKLKKITEASFAAADEDCSGLVPMHHQKKRFFKVCDRGGGGPGQATGALG